MDQANEIRETLKQWIVLDDTERKLRDELKKIKQDKKTHANSILVFMRDNEVDNFTLEGSGIGSVNRMVRTNHPPLKRSTLRTQLLLHFADQPQKVGEFLRSIEDGNDGMSTSTPSQRELLVRRIPRRKDD